MLALTKKTVSSRAVLAGAAMAAIAAPRIGRAADAEFSYKFATGQAPTHPVNIRLGEALDRVRTRSNGRLDIRLFPANQLGTETDVMSQVRNGGIEFLLLSASILATLVPNAGIANTAFAFPDYDAVWKGMDGGLGTYTQAQIEKVGLVANNKIWNNGSARSLPPSATFVGRPISQASRSASPRAHADVVLRRYRRGTNAHELRGGIHRVANRCDRQAGKRALAHPDDAALRGAEILRADQP